MFMQRVENFAAAMVSAFAYILSQSLRALPDPSQPLASAASAQ